MVIDLSLYLVADLGALARDDYLARVNAALEAGVSVVQVRAPRLSDDDFLSLAQEVKTLADRAHTPLIVNDRVEIALHIGAAGVHLGQDDASPVRARAMLGDAAIIGLSVGSFEEFEASQEVLSCVDYLGIGPVYPTSTKTDAGAAIGIDGMAAVGRAAHKPYVGIGGIDATNARDVIHAGACGVAVVSAIMSASDPFAATKTIRESFS